MFGNRILPHFVIALVLAAALYAGGFIFDQHLRARRGPWVVEFTRAADQSPMIVIEQPALGIGGVRFIFPGETVESQSETVRFDVPEGAIPWGRLKYEDLTYLPGVVTLEVFGHEIEMLPRRLYVNRQAVAWPEGGTNIFLGAAERPAELPDPKDSRKKARAGTPPAASEPDP